MRTVLYLRYSELLRILRHCSELIEILVILSAIPDLDLPCSVLGTCLDDVYVIALYDLIRMNGLHTFRTKCIGLTNLLYHKECIDIP